MMSRATPKSAAPSTGRRRWFAVGVGLAQVAAVCAETPPSAAEMALKAYLRARTALEANGPAGESGWILGRACFDWAEFATNHTQRATLAQEGIRACEEALSLQTNQAAAHYYLAMNQGQLARTMNLGALKLVNQMEAHFKTVLELEPGFDQAGPDRNLGLLYLEAPGWPMSVGNPSKARSHLRRAVELAPEFPENRLNLMDAYARWKEYDLLRRELKQYDGMMEEARSLFSGERWYWAWVEWGRRLDELRSRAHKAPPDLRSPKARG